jgi:hypothetical protein
VDHALDGCQSDPGAGEFAPPPRACLGRLGTRRQGFAFDVDRLPDS